MDYFKSMIFKDGKPDYKVIAVKSAFLLMAIVYTILFFVFKNAAIGSYLYPANHFVILHIIMFLPVIACLFFTLIAHSSDWMRVFWQMLAVMIVCLIITGCASVFGGFKSETDNKKDYLVFDSFLTENKALDPAGEDVPEGTVVPTFEEEIKQLFPANLDDVKSPDYFYDYTSLPILDGYFDVYLKAKYNDGDLAAEITRLQGLYPTARQLADPKDSHVTHYIIRENDNKSSYFYTFYSVNSDKNTIYYYVCFSERSSSVPLFEKDGFDLGRVGNPMEDGDTIVVPASSSPSSIGGGDTSSSSDAVSDNAAGDASSNPES